MQVAKDFQDAPNAMVYLTGIHIEHDGPGDEGTSTLRWLAKTYLPGADWTASESDSGTGVMHVTVLYQGKAEKDKFKAYMRDLDVPAQFSGKLSGFQSVRISENKGVVVLRIDCEPLQDFHAALRDGAFRATGAKAEMGLHTGPGGEHCFKHDYSPHITLATYSDLAKMDRDMDKLVYNGHPRISRVGSDGAVRMLGVTLSNWVVYA